MLLIMHILVSCPASPVCFLCIYKMKGEARLYVIIAVIFGILSCYYQFAVSTTDEPLTSIIAHQEKDQPPQKLTLCSLRWSRIMLTYSDRSLIPPYKIAMWKKYHDGLEVEVYGDMECREFLMSNAADWVLKLFDLIPHGPIKADLFRVAYLYSQGGAYGDVDMEIHSNLLQYCTSGCYNSVKSSFSDEVNNTFIVCEPNHWICGAILGEYERKYKHRDIYDYWTFSIGQALHRVMYAEGNSDKSDIDEHPWCKMSDGLRLPFIELPSLEEIAERHGGRIVMHNRSNDYHDHKFTIP